MEFYNVARSAVYVFFKVFFRVEVDGKENLPTDEAFIVCSNHTSNLDPPLLGACMPFQLAFMAKEELFKNKIFGALIRALGAFPVRRGTGDIGALRSAVKLLKSGKRMVIFPEGGRSDGKHLRKGKRGAALIAVKAGVGIIPVGIEGRYKPFCKIKVHIGKMIRLDEYAERKIESEDLKSVTDKIIMPAISQLSGVRTYEDRISG